MAKAVNQEAAKLSPTEFRKRFPIFESKILVNSCAKGALSGEVEEAYDRYLHSWRTGGSPWDEWVGVLESTRSAYSEFLGCAPDQLALTYCASTAMNVIASALDFSGQRNKIIVGDFEFPTSAQIWFAQQRRGAQITRIRADGAGSKLPLEAYARGIDEETLLVPTTHVCFRNGFRVDIRGVARAAREAGAYSLVDDYQCCGTRPIDLKDLDCDFLLSGCYKYLLGSSGLAFLYVREELIQKLEPTVTGWFAQENPFAFDIERQTYHATARRFETGTPPVPSLYAAEAGIRLVMEVGLERIRDHVEKLVTEAIRKARERGIEILTSDDPAEHGPLVVLRSTDSSKAVAVLEKEGIITSNRHDGLRLSFHYYNVPEDVDAIFDVLDRHPKLMVRTK